MNSIAFHKISKRFGSVRALDDVSFTINPAQAVLLAGPNGAGKSTIINILLGLYLPDLGEIRSNGSPVVIDNKFKARMGYLPENVAFSENLSGWAMLSFYARARGVRKMRMQAVMERIGLSEHMRRSIAGYSKGMRQRLALGISILHDPEILIMDEPTSGLDQEGLGVLWSVIDEWRGKGRLTLISSHDLGILEKRVDEFCILRKGSVIACDDPEALRKRAALPVKVSFTLTDAPGVNGAFLEKLNGHFSSQSVRQVDATYQIDIEPDRIVELMGAAFSSDRRIIQSIRVMEPELEDIYQHLLESS